MTHIDQLATAAAANLQAALTATLLNAIERVDLATLERISDNAEEDGSEHTIEQLDGALAFADDTDEPTAILIDLFAAVAALAASQWGHILNTAQPRVRTAGVQLANDTLQRFAADTEAAVSLAVGRTMQTTGSVRSRMLQLRRSIGLSAAQVGSLDHIRTALLRRLEKQARETTEAERLDNIDRELGIYRRALSAPQIRMLRKAFAAGITEAGAEALLDRHASALRAHRVQATAGFAVHAAAESGKLIGWQVAQFFGAVPSTARRYWETAGDERVRHTHADVPSLNPDGVPLDKPFQTPLGELFAPPMEFGCRCRAVLKAG